MFSIFSWKRRRTDLLAAVICAALAQMAAATETVTVRLGPGYRDFQGKLLSDRQTLPQVMSGAEEVLPFLLADIRTCAEFLATPRGMEKAVDTVRDTWVKITSQRVNCWALSQARPDARVLAVRPTDRITLAMIRAIMDHLEQMSMQDDKFFRTFMWFPGGEITCDTLWECHLELPDGLDPPEQSLCFELLMAAGDERFISVAQMVHGSSKLFYGVRLSGIQGSNPEVSVFFDMD